MELCKQKRGEVSEHTKMTSRITIPKADYTDLI